MARVRLHCVALLCAGFSAVSAFGQVVDSFTIVDGNCEYSLTNIIGLRFDGDAGIAALQTGNTNHMRQNWFWYHTPTDSREYALSTQIRGSASGNQARLVYLEPVTDGQIPDALLFDLEYTLHDMQGAAPPACERCELVIAIKVRNFLTAMPLGVELFSYNDMDLNLTPANDGARISGSNNQIQLLVDPGGVSPDGVDHCPAGGVYKVSSTDHTLWEIGPAPTIINRLSDAVPDVLANAVSPFGPGNYTGAQEWRFSLGEAFSLDDEWIGSVVKEVVIHGPGDIDGDCDVDLDDLTLLLQQFGRICP